MNKYNWDEWYNLAKAYYEHYGDLEIPQRFKTFDGINYDEKGIALGTWINTQRQAYKGIGTVKITPEKIKLLEEIGIKWYVHKDNWVKKYQLVKAYYECYGNLEIPTNFKTFDGVNYDEKGIPIGKWITNQRQAFKGNGTAKISPEQIRLLNTIGMRWETIDLMEEWIKKYNLAKTYYDYYGNLEIPQNFKTFDGISYDEKGVALGAWILYQRESNKGKIQHKINSNQIELLEEIGMKWYVHKDAWKKNYQLAKAYYEHYGNLEVPQSFKTFDGVNYDEKGISLGAWIANQRNAYKSKGKHKINSNQIELLEEIEMKWDIHKDYWEKNYQLLKAYYNYYGNLEIPQSFKTFDGVNYDEKGIDLFNWINTQRSAYKCKGRRKITPERIELLEALKMRLENIDRMEEWMQKYNLAKVYYEHYENLEIRRKFRTLDGIEYNVNGIDLGAWITNQREAYKGKGGNKLNPEQIKLLEKIKMKWFSDNIDYKLQQEEINKQNLQRKKKEIENRFYTVLNGYDEDSLPTPDELNEKVLNKLILPRRK